MDHLNCSGYDSYVVAGRPLWHRTSHHHRSSVWVEMMDVECAWSGKSLSSILPPYLPP